MTIQVYKANTEEIIAIVETDGEVAKGISDEDYRISIDGEELGFDTWYESLDDFK